MSALEPPRVVVPCVRCGTLCVEVRDATGRHAWWQCVLCNDLPYVPLDWRVQWPATGALSSRD